MAYKTILTDLSDGTLTITLNRPDKLNALNDEMIKEISVEFERACNDDEVNCVVLTGAGRGFCSGGDLNMSIYNTTDLNILDSFMNTVSRMVMSIRECTKPVIAAVNGAAAGGGCNLALACDMVIASDKAKFSEMFALKSLHPDTGGTCLLPRLVGVGKAMELMLTGRTVDAEEAARIGMANAVVPADELLAHVKEIADQVCRISPAVSRMIKASVYAGASSDLPTALENEKRAVLMNMISGAWKEAQ